MSVSPQLMKEIEDAFFLFAFDDSKKVTTREVGAVIRSVGLNPTEVQLKEICGAISSKFGGQVDAKGLAQVLNGRVTELSTTNDELRDAFQVFDKNGNGMISVQDLKLSLTTLGERLPDEIVDEIVREVDQNGEGQVNFEDVIHILLG